MIVVVVPTLITVIHKFVAMVRFTVKGEVILAVIIKFIILQWQFVVMDDYSTNGEVLHVADHVIIIVKVICVAMVKLSQEFMVHLVAVLKLIFLILRHAVTTIFFLEETGFAAVGVKVMIRANKFAV